MPKLAKPKKRSRFGEAPPVQTDTRGNLSAPELAPTSLTSPTRVEHPHVDGRTLRVTGRTEQFATRVRPEWKLKLHELSKKTQLMYVEILERALEAFERELNRS